MARLSLLTLQLLLLASGTFCATAATFTLYNNCQYPVWPVIYFTGGASPLNTTALFSPLQNGESRPISLPTNWNGRIWGRTLCSTDSTGNFSCATGDCGSGDPNCSGFSPAPPVTLAEFSLDGVNGQDFYDVSLVDGYNLPILIAPDGKKCKSTGCAADLNGVCPSELQVVRGGTVVGCRSQCDKISSAQYCCSGSKNSNTCKPTSYPAYFKQACPTAYSYPFDDADATFTCNATDYLIGFCQTTTNSTVSVPGNSSPVCGSCGFNSYCRFPGGKSTSVCECPSGYSFSDPRNSSSDCNPDFDSWSCRAGAYDGLLTKDMFDLIKMPNVDWPTGDYEWFDSISEDGCVSACLSDCLCTVAIYRNNSCWKKKYPLSNGTMDSKLGGKAIFKVPNANMSIASDQGGWKKDRATLIIAGSVVLGGSIFLNFLLLSAFSVPKFFPFHKKLHLPGFSMAGMNIRSFTYKELEKATGGFKEELGRGAFGTVYKGAIESEANRTIIAVKKLDKVVHKGEKEFKSEVNTIGKTHHKNLVKLIGFCDEGLHRLLVYEYMSNGSLANFLFGGIKLNWSQRIQIASGIARGLLYLHEECSTQIIHCDIKPQNILLDENFTARISDFGLAKLLSTDQSRTSTSIRGTKGYVAPEWFRNTAVTARVDIFSFGVLLLEIVCRRKNVDTEQDGDEKVILTDWAYECYRVGRLDLLVGNDEEAMGDRQRSERLVAVALWCIQEEPSLRPSMKNVVQMLEGAVIVPSPPNLSLI